MKSRELTTKEAIMVTKLQMEARIAAKTYQDYILEVFASRGLDPQTHFVNMNTGEIEERNNGDGSTTASDH